MPSVIVNSSNGAGPSLPAIIAALSAVSTVTGSKDNIALGTGLVFPAYTVLFAAIAKSCPAGQNVFSGSVSNADPIQNYALLQLAIGAAGLEVVVSQTIAVMPGSLTGYFTFNIPMTIPAASRITIRGTTPSAVAGSVCYLGYNVGQVA